MTVEKRNRVVAAITVNVILLIVILAAVVIYQLVVLANLKHTRNEIRQEITELEELIEKGEADLEYLQSSNHLRDLAIREYGYHFPDNK